MIIVKIVDGDRERGAFSNPVVNYQLFIKTSVRCSGFLSNQRYKSYDVAIKAVERIEQALKRSE